MPVTSHPVARVERLAARDDGCVEASVVLDCGCRVEVVVPDDRVIGSPDAPRVVGKVRCPNGHPPGRPRTA